jgi:hypothetical protein
MFVSSFQNRGGGGVAARCTAGGTHLADHQRKNFFFFFKEYSSRPRGWKKHSTAQQICRIQLFILPGVILKSSLLQAMAGIWIGACLE